MGIKQTLENMVNRWLFSEEIEQHEQQVESGIVPRPQPAEADMKDELERLKRVHDEQIEIIKAEDHTNAPSEEDIARYLNYHVNMVDNIKMIKERTGESPSFPVPETPLTEDEYRVMVQEKGWNGMRMSCGLPTGDISKPKKPWVTADMENKWTVNEEPEKPKYKKRGI